MKLLALAIIFSFALATFATAPLPPCGNASVQAATALFKINNPDVKNFLVEEEFVKSTPQEESSIQVYDVSATANGVRYSAYRMTCLETAAGSATVIGFSIPHAN